MSENSNAVVTDTATSKTLARLVRAVKRQAEAKPKLARNVAVFFVALALLTTGFLANGCIPTHRPEIEVRPEPKSSEAKAEAVVTPYQVQAKVGSPEEVKTSFVVQSAGQTDNLAFLNDQRNFKAPGVLTVVVVKASVPGFNSPKELVGKTIEVKGQVTQYHGKPQIKVTDPSKISIK